MKSVATILRNRNNDVHAILNLLEESKGVNAEGKPAYIGWYVQTAKMLLPGLLKFEAKYSISHQNQLVQKALFGLVGGNDFSQRSFLKQINKAAQYIEEMPSSKYHLLTTIATGGRQITGKVYIGKTTFFFLKNLQKRS